jgi:hypothetical protein
MDATDPNLTPFERHGGKLIMTAGWSDPVISPEDTVAYYQALTKASGGRERTLQFARLFMAPGMGHSVMCPYSQVARYQGTGSVDVAANFACVMPATASDGKSATRH